MSIFLKPVQRANPSDPDAPKKWYPVQYTTKMVDENEVAMLIADETTLNPMEGRWREAGQFGKVSWRGGQNWRYNISNKRNNKYGD